MRVGGAGFKPDDDLIESIKPVIQGTLMISQTFEDMIKQLENATVEVSADSVITGPARGLLMVGHKFPGLYTQEGWDKHVSRAIRERARTLSTRYAEAGLPWPADQIEADLRQNYLGPRRRHATPAGSPDDPRGPGRDARGGAGNARAIRPVVT